MCDGRTWRKVSQMLLHPRHHSLQKRPHRLRQNRRRRRRLVHPILEEGSLVCRGELEGAVALKQHQIRPLQTHRYHHLRPRPRRCCSRRQEELLLPPYQGVEVGRTVELVYQQVVEGCHPGQLVPPLRHPHLPHCSRNPHRSHPSYHFHLIFLLLARRRASASLPLLGSAHTVLASQRTHYRGTPGCRSRREVAFYCTGP
mmetsp:Transcript_30487/g.51542  ORF Transcript_30487/g.51542 Transcript_30487/m.51542 type:complete len:200 (-) Transcript_30487:491-1090(-)